MHIGFSATPKTAMDYDGCKTFFEIKVFLEKNKITIIMDSNKKEALSLSSSVIEVSALFKTPLSYKDFLQFYYS